MFPRLPSFFPSTPPYVSESIDYRQFGVWSRASTSIPLDHFGGGAPPYLSAMLCTLCGALSFSDTFGAPWPAAHSSKLTPGARKNIPSMMRLLLHQVAISVLKGPGAPWGPAGRLPRALDRTGRQNAVHARPQDLRTAVIVQDDGPCK